MIPPNSPTYRLEYSSKSITCLICSRTSYNENDIKERYCGYCKRFHEDRLPRAPMALFDYGHRLQLPSDYFLKKQNDDTWQVGKYDGKDDIMLDFQLTTNVPVGLGGSFDSEATKFALAMSGRTDAGEE